MLLPRAVTLIQVISIVLAKNSKLRELIVKIYSETDSADVYFLGSVEDFSSYFMKTEVTIPVLSLDVNFRGELRQSSNAFIVFLVPENDHANWELLQNVIESLLVRKFALISTKTFDKLHQYFSFFAEKNFTRIFGMLWNSSSFAFLPFADNTVQKLHEDDHIPDALKDLNGFAIRTTIQSDLPRTFWYPHRIGPERIGGRFGQIFLQFLRRHNATFKEIRIDNSRKLDIEAVINATVNREIDVSMNAYFQQNNLDMSYPVAVYELVLMVPYNGFIPPHDYFWRPFSASVWLCIGLSFILMIVAKIFLDSLFISEVDIWSSFYVIYLTLLNFPAPRPSSNYRFYCFVYLFAFIFGILYGTYFQSFLTVFIKIKQFDTIEDLAENNIFVMMSSFRWEHLKRGSYPEELREIIKPTDPSVYVHQLVSMRNTSFAYALEEDRCEFLISFQSFYRKSLFRRAHQAISSLHTGFLLPFYSPFKDILNNFIIEIGQTGLIEKWDSDVIFQTKEGGFRMEIDKRHEHADTRVPLAVHHLQFAWNSLTIGLAVSTLVFIGECVCYRQSAEKSALSA